MHFELKAYACICRYMSLSGLLWLGWSQMTCCFILTNLSKFWKLFVIFIFFFSLPHEIYFRNSWNKIYIDKTVLRIWKRQAFYYEKVISKFKFKFIYSLKPLWHGIWGTLSDNKIEYKHGQRYRYTQLIHIQKKRKEIHITNYCFILLWRTDKLIYFQITYKAF